MNGLDERCPQCHALVRAGTAWCTLCHADLRPAPPAQPAASAEPSAPPVVDDLPDEVATGLVAEPEPPRRGGKHARPSVAPAPSPAAAELLDTLPPEYTDLLVDPDDTEVAFAVLRAEGKDPYLAKWEGPLSAPGARAALIIGGAVGLALTLFVAAALVGALFR